MIRIKELRKAFRSRQGAVEALKGITLEVPEGEFCVLLGPSGCGKTTTLRCVAGLEKPDGGEIEISGVLVSSPAAGVYVPTEKRDIGMVFQSYAIWPHMTVFQNVAFPLTQGKRRLRRAAVVEKVREALRLVRVAGLEGRPATDLSGGQQQRVAMARAMVTEPQILLMDEPLSNLDARLRAEMRQELRRITGSIRVTTLYVTHDQDEALSLGDTICVMNQGQIVQTGSPHEVYTHPRDLFVAEFLGEMNVIKGRVVAPGLVECLLGRIECTFPAASRPGAEVRLAIRPEHVTLAPLARAAHEPDAAEGTILSRLYLGDVAILEVELRGVRLKAKLPGDAEVALGERAAVRFQNDRWHVYP